MFLSFPSRVLVAQEMMEVKRQFLTRAEDLCGHKKRYGQDLPASKHIADGSTEMMELCRYLTDATATAQKPYQST